MAANLSKQWELSLGTLMGLALLLCKQSLQISIVSSSGILVNKKSTFRIARRKSGSCSNVFSAI